MREQPHSNVTPAAFNQTSQKWQPNPSMLEKIQSFSSMLGYVSGKDLTGV